MKKIGDYVLRGRIPARVETRIQLFDGQFDTAYQINSIKCAVDLLSTPREAYLVVTTAANVFGTTANNWDWSDNYQVAWAYMKTSLGANEGFAQYTNVDENNLIIEDLFLNGEADAGDINYEIHLTKYDISEAEGALTMVRNRSQA